MRLLSTVAIRCCWSIIVKISTFTTTLYPGCLDAVEALDRAGYRVGICTNKPEALAVLLMDRLGVLDRFGSLIGADTLATRKPDPAPFLEAVRRAGGDPGMSVLVGDTETDARTARAARVPLILVGFGPEGRAVERLRPDAMLSAYGELGKVVEDLIGRPE